MSAGRTSKWPTLGVAEDRCELHGLIGRGAEQLASMSSYVPVATSSALRADCTASGDPVSLEPGVGEARLLGRVDSGEGESVAVHLEGHRTLPMSAQPSAQRADEGHGGAGHCHRELSPLERHALGACGNDRAHMLDVFNIQLEELPRAGTKTVSATSSTSLSSSPARCRMIVRSGSMRSTGLLSRIRASVWPIHCVNAHMEQRRPLRTSRISV